MRKPGVHVAALVAVVLLAGCGGVEKKADHRLPDVTLKGLTSTSPATSLRKLRGPAVVNLWANWCKPCRREMPIYQEFHVKHPEVDVLGVDWRDPNRESALKFAAATGVTYPLVVDPEGSLVKARGLPSLILLDAKGRIAYQAYVEIKSRKQLEDLVRKHLGADL